MSRAQLDARSSRAAIGAHALANPAILVKLKRGKNPGGAGLARRRGEHPGARPVLASEHPVAYGPARASIAMTLRKPADFPALAKPPIVEVVCGVLFEPLPELDPLVLGVYWDRRRAVFPKRMLQLALAEGPGGVGSGGFPMRAVLSSADDQFILQLQHDRFFMNWRAVGVEYPRFSETHGEGGLLRRAMEEYGRFSEFVAERTGARPSATRIELTKIDVLRRGDHWTGLDDLARLVPVTSVFSEIQQSDQREVNLRFVERGADGAALVHVATLLDGSEPMAIRVEARRVAPACGDVPTAFNNANAVLNDVFFKLIPDAVARFGAKEGA